MKGLSLSTYKINISNPKRIIPRTACIVREAKGMLEEISKIKDLEVYAPNGLFVGYADKYVMDPANKCISGIYVDSASPVLVDAGVSIKIPFRWVRSIGDVIILNTFPQHVHRDGSVE